MSTNERYTVEQVCALPNEWSAKATAATCSAPTPSHSTPRLALVSDAWRDAASDILGKSSNLFQMLCDEAESNIAALSAPKPAAQGEAVAVVDAGEEGMFVEILYGPDGSPLKVGDKLYTAPPTQPAVRVPEGWREFIEGCANSAGGMVNGNHLSERAKCLLATSGENETANGAWTLECDGYKSHWPTAEIAERERANLAILGYRATVTPSDSIYFCSHCKLPNHAGEDHADCESAAKLNAELAASPAPSEGGKGVDRG